MNSLIYMFDICLQNGDQYYLTSSSISHKIGNISYLPNSGLSFVFGEFDESAHNRACIKGIFEEGGIGKKENLAGAKLKINYLRANALVPFITYFCTKYITKDLEFEIWCEPEVIKYNQSLLQMFSKTCRANFGDNRCKVRTENYALKTEIYAVTDNVLKCDTKEFGDGYFRNGTLQVVKEEGSKYDFKILSHFGNNIELDMKFEFDFKKNKLVTLIPGCDKNYRTCCYSYNNAVNFRGEPFIPESNILEN